MLSGAWVMTSRRCFVFTGSKVADQAGLSLPSTAGRTSCQVSSVVMLKLEMADRRVNPGAVVPARDHACRSEFDWFVPAVFDDMGQCALAQPACAVVLDFPVAVVEEYRSVDAVRSSGT